MVSDFQLKPGHWVLCCENLDPIENLYFSWLFLRLSCNKRWGAGWGTQHLHCQAEVEVQDLHLAFVNT